MEIQKLKIAIVGGGNLGRSVADGFLKSGISASKLTVSRRRVQLLDDLAAKGINIEKDNKIAVAEAGVIIIAVKPYQAVEVITENKTCTSAWSDSGLPDDRNQHCSVKGAPSNRRDPVESDAQYCCCTSGINDFDCSTRLFA